MEFLFKLVVLFIYVIYVNICVKISNSMSLNKIKTINNYTMCHLNNSIIFLKCTQFIKS